MRYLLVAPLLLGMIACGSSTTTGPKTTTTTPGPGPFAGIYATRVTLLQSSCGAVTVQDNPTTVTHDTATRAVSFAHVGQTYSGTVGADSSFTTVPRQVNVNDGFLYTITLAGKFRPLAFDADATIDRTGGGGPCRFSVRWQATR
jgi:hypothetical protein